MRKDLELKIYNIYDNCNSIEEVKEHHILDKIDYYYPRIHRKTKVFIYANVCSLLFGDNIDEIINTMNY